MVRCFWCLFSFCYVYFRQNNFQGNGLYPVFMNLHIDILESRNQEHCLMHSDASYVINVNVTSCCFSCEYEDSHSKGGPRINEQSATGKGTLWHWGCSTVNATFVSQIVYDWVWCMVTVISDRFSALGGFGMNCWQTLTMDFRQEMTGALSVNANFNVNHFVATFLTSWA